MLDPKNPIIIARKARGLSRTSFVTLVNISYCRAADVEAGRQRSLPPAWRADWERAGFDFDAIQAAYKTWREGRTAALRAEVAGFAANG